MTTWALVGPTAAGKTAAALAVAARHADGGLPPVEVVSLDAMQVFRGLDIGTAKPTPEERGALPHHLLDLRDPDDPLGAGTYATLAAEAIASIRARGAVPLLVGGTPFYLRVLREGLSPVPAIAAPLREALREEATTDDGYASLRAELERIDPAWASAVHPNDRQRTLRGVEVARGTGRTLSAWQEEPRQGALPGGLAVVILDPGPDALRARIAERAGGMVGAGLVAEVATLLAAGLDRHAHGLRAPGYREALAVLDGDLPAADLADAVATAHHQYARRQRTFLRREDAAARCVTMDGAVDALAAGLARGQDGSAP